MRKNFRIFPRMDIKGDKLIKTIRLEGVKVVGDPKFFAKKYYEQGADEIFLNDAVASLYGRNSLFDVIKEVSKEVFIPITLAGGLRSLNDVEKALNSGADKVAINTILHSMPDLINDIEKNFGTNCMVLQIDAKKIGNNKWEPYIDCGRERTNKDLLDWVKEGIDRGAGEIFLTSIDNEGTKHGFDLNLISEVSKISKIPLICSGGAGNFDHIYELINSFNIDGAAFSNLLHIEKIAISEIKNFLTNNLNKIKIRK
jgi:cyclase